MHKHNPAPSLFPKIKQLSHRWFVVGILCAVGLFGTVQAWKQSMTTDEGIHVASAYLAITRGEHRFDPEHPFLFKYLTALPLFVLQPNLPADDEKLWEAAKPSYYDSWQEARQWSDSWMYTSGNNAQLMIFLARIPGVLALVALCWLVWLTTRHWFGDGVSRWALFFTATNPTLLGHGPLTNTDIPVALAILFVIWRLWLYFEEQTWKNVTWVGAALGIALTTKFSALTILPLALIWLVYTAFSKRHGAVKTITHGIAALLITWTIIWTVYFWQSPLHLDGTTNVAITTASDILDKYGLNINTVSHKLQYILPSAFTKGVLLTVGGSVFGRGVYFLGSYHGSGVWYYFPSMFLLKSQLIVILLALTGIGVFAKKALQPWGWKPVSVLLLTAAFILLYTSLNSKLNLGIRHISPLLPLLSIFLATTVVCMRDILKRPGFTLVIITGCLLPIMRQATDLIGFNNAIVYPESQAYRYYNDSNLDWGQQTQRISKVVTEKFGGKKLYVNYRWNPYGIAYFGTENSSFDPLNPPPNSLVAVTATQMSATEYAAFAEREADYILDKNTYFYLLGDK
ncbi:phospholipid carrier-dependent glycosyltransferase [soil metagenome]